MNAPMNPDRREFMKASGALVVGIALAPELAIAQGAPAALPGSLNNNRMLSSWLRINPSGTVTTLSRLRNAEALR